VTFSFSNVELGKIIVLYLGIYGMQHAYTSYILTCVFTCECRYHVQAVCVIPVASKELIIVAFFLQGLGNSTG